MKPYGLIFLLCFCHFANAPLAIAKSSSGTSNYYDLAIDQNEGEIRSVGMTGEVYQDGFTFSGWFFIEYFPEGQAAIFGYEKQNLLLEFSTDSGLELWLLNTAAQIPDVKLREWFNLSVTLQGNTARFYKNGIELLDREIETTNLRFPSGPDNYLKLGNYWGSARQLTFWGRTLTENQLVAEIFREDSETLVPKHQWLLEEGLGVSSSDTGTEGSADFVSETGRSLWRSIYSHNDVLHNTKRSLQTPKRQPNGSEGSESTLEASNHKVNLTEKLNSATTTTPVCEIDATTSERDFTACSTIDVSSPFFLPAGESLLLADGAEVKFSENSFMKVSGKMELLGNVIFTGPAGTTAQWPGLRFERADAQVLSNIVIQGAAVGVTIVSSPDVHIEHSTFRDNSIGVRLISDDGVRNRVNRIQNSEFYGNDVAISVSSTGLDASENLIQGEGHGIVLSGGSCGGGTVCGWRASIKNNLFNASGTAIRSYGFFLDVTLNDIYNANVGMDIDMLSGRVPHVIDQNNIQGWQTVGVANRSQDPLNIEGVWLSDSDKKFAVCDIYENIARGKISYAANSAQFENVHGYDLPLVADSGVQDGESYCPDDGYVYVDVDTVWAIDQVITESTYFASEYKVQVPENAVIQVYPNVTLNFAGILELPVQGTVSFSSADASQGWAGLRFERADAQVISNILVEGASTGVSIVSSPDVHIEHSTFRDNSIGVRLISDDGVRNRVNRIQNSEFYGNDVAISVSSTGLDASENLIQGEGHGIVLSGGSCGGGTVCGWRASIKNNLFNASGTAIRSYGFFLDVTLNDIYNANVGMDIDMLSGRVPHVIDQNNIQGWQTVGVANRSQDPLNIEGVWLSDSDKKFAVCDIYENIARGKISYAANSAQFENVHGYDLPLVADSGVQDGESYCPDDGYVYVDVDTVWAIDQVITESTYFASEYKVQVPENAVIQVYPNVTLNFAGILELPVQGTVSFSSADASQGWAGLRFERADAQVISNILVEGASTGVSIVSSPDVHIEHSTFRDNSIGVRLISDDGVRNRVNRIQNSEFYGNDVAISVSSTGLDAVRNLLQDGDTGVALYGSSCGGGGACGYRATLTENRFYGNSEGLHASAHSIDAVNNSFSCNQTHVELNQYGGSSIQFSNTNFGQALSYYFVMNSEFDVDLQASFVGEGINLSELIYDSYDDITLGAVSTTVVTSPIADSRMLFDTDTDGDLLSDYEELSSGLCAGRADSDQDGADDDKDAFPLDPNEDTDTDGDGVGDNRDNCPNLSNHDQFNTDKDSQGDVCDPDDDNDGLTDIKEADIGTDPLKRDSDGDGWSDKTEYEEGSDPLTAASQPKLPSGLPIWLLFEASNSSIERLQQ